MAIEDIGGGHFRARVIDSPTGQATVEFDLPFSDLELENFLLRIGRPRSGVRRIESPENAAARDFGTRLYDAVFAGDVGTQWLRSIDATERDQCGLRLRLRLSEAPQLADLPWEYLYSPVTDDFVVLSSWTPVVRYISLERGAPPLQVTPPLKMLAMVSSPTDYPPLDVEAEWARLDEGLEKLVGRGVVEIERLERATLRELQRALVRDDFHLFHFIGHGGFDAAADDGVLLLETEEGRAREVTGHQLGTILDDARTIRVAVLNACEGARTSETDPFAGVAQSLVARGIPAVVAMQFEITDRAAIVFAHEFYTAVSGGLPVEAAVGEARRAIFGTKNDVEWGTAVLYMRAEDGRLFDLSEPPEPTLVVEHDTEVMEATVPAAEPSVPEPDPEPPAAQPAAVVPDPELPVSEPSLTEPAPIVSAPESEPEPPMAEPPPQPVGVEDEPATRELPVVEPEPVQPGVVRHRSRVVGMVISGLAVVALLVLFVMTRDRGEDTTTTSTDTAGSTQTEAVDSSEVTMFPVSGVVVDGDLGDWETLPVAYQLDHPVSDNLAGERVGDDSVGIVGVGYDDENLYLAVTVDDDVYAQANQGNQIWRGDALDVNLYAGQSQVPGHPDGRTFQLTMTPVVQATGSPGAVLFVGNGEQFADNTTELPIDLEGGVDPDGAWRLEARIPWDVFQLDGPPGTLDAALFAVFDNDGESSGGRPLQAEILTNVDEAFFQQPKTWGTLTRQ